ncbi:competence/damage-inducible protein A [Patulibacter americanus]|uniref:competence/damage-inducible protein A n=1 Tax=Patulibacter americanus TaxID=588672 RepID=UPI0003B31F85|nr:competence/damage-inducible protein A [Patulibacter americanus]
MSAPRAVVVITGTEVLGGWVADKNGPWLAQRLGELGVVHVSTVVVGDRPEDLVTALSNARDRGVELVITSGGLGPTEDDLTTRVVAEFTRRTLALDEALEGRIWSVLEPMSKRWPGVDQAAVREANRKQALVPAGATVLEPIGTAPGLIVPPPEGEGGPTIVVLPGPPSELQAMWRATVDLPELHAAIPGAERLQGSVLRLFGIPESDLAGTMRAAREEGIAIDDLEITTCMRRGEIEIVNRWPAEADATGRAFEAFVADRHGDALFSADGRTIDQLVLDGLRERSWTVGTAESCTGGLLAGRLTDLPGSSAVVAGGIVSYANAVKESALGVPREMLEAHGAVSAEVARAMAEGALEALGVAVALSTTGVAGPGGGSEEKPVGTVFVAVLARDGGLVRRLRIPGDRAAVRDRTTTAALHLLRRVLAGERDAA